jgi:hypothetical protein
MRRDYRDVKLNIILKTILTQWNKWIQNWSLRENTDILSGLKQFVRRISGIKSIHNSQKDI